MEVTYKNYRKKIGKEVMKKRNAMGISRESLAAKLDGICTKTVERIEKANYPRDVGLHPLQVICAELDISVKMLLGKHGGKP